VGKRLSICVKSVLLDLLLPLHGYDLILAVIQGSQCLFHRRKVPGQRAFLEFVGVAQSVVGIKYHDGVVGQGVVELKVVFDHARLIPVASSG